MISSVGKPLLPMLLMAVATSIAALPATAQKIVAASDVGYAPYSMANPQGGFQGIDIDIAEELSKQLGFNVEVIDQPWASTFAGLNAKKFDMALAPIIITKERSAGLLFTQGYGDGTYQFVLRKDAPQVNKESDLRGKVIAVNRGNIFDKWLSARQSEFGWTINRYDKNSDAIQAVSSKQADAAFTFSATVGWSAKKDPALVPSNFVIVSGEVIAYAFRKGDNELRNKIDMALQCLRKNGTVAAIYKKWTGLEPIAGGVMTTLLPGRGQPGFEGYEPTPHAFKCK